MLDTLIQPPMNEYIAHDHVKKSHRFFTEIVGQKSEKSGKSRALAYHYQEHVILAFSVPD